MIRSTVNPSVGDDARCEGGRRAGAMGGPSQPRRYFWPSFAQKRPTYRRLVPSLHRLRRIPGPGDRSMFNREVGTRHEAPLTATMISVWAVVPVSVCWSIVFRSSGDFQNQRWKGGMLAKGGPMASRAVGFLAFLYPRMTEDEPF